MKTRLEIQAEIIRCVESIYRSAPPRQHYYDGMLNGLVWALTGEYHLTDQMTADEIFTVAGIEHTVAANNTVHYPLL